MSKDIALGLGAFAQSLELGLHLLRPVRAKAEFSAKSGELSLPAADDQ
jgi:hypothetical protein